MALLAWDPDDVGPERPDAASVIVAHARVDKAVATPLAQGSREGLARGVRPRIEHGPSLLDGQRSKWCTVSLIAVSSRSAA